MTRINYHRPQGTCCNSNSNSNRGNNKFYKNIIYILNYDYDYLPSSIFFLSSVFCLLSSIFYPCLLFSFFYRYHTRLQVDMNVVYECSTCMCTHVMCVFVCSTSTVSKDINACPCRVLFQLFPFPFPEQFFLN